MESHAELPMIAPLPRPDLRWPVITRVIVLCAILALIEGTQIHFAAIIKGQPPLPLSRELLGSLPTWLSIAVVTPAVLALTRRFPLDFGGSLRSLWIHAAACMVFPFVHIAVAMIGWYAVYMRHEPDFNAASRVATVTASHYVTEILLYWLIVGAYTSWSWRRGYHERQMEAARLQAERARLEAERAQLEASLVQARLGALRSQLNPHFLFNTLNAITVLAEAKDHDSVFAMTRGLARLLRSSLERSEQVLPLRDELALTREYLAIEQVRFGSRLVVEWDIDPDALACAVPSLLLQPLIENALRHGVGSSADDVMVEVRVRRREQQLDICVADTGRGIAADGITERTGLGATRARLSQLYGEQATMVIGRRKPRGFIVTIQIPTRVPEITECLDNCAH